MSGNFLLECENSYLVQKGSNKNRWKERCCRNVCGGSDWLGGGWMDACVMPFVYLCGCVMHKKNIHWWSQIKNPGVICWFLVDGWIRREARLMLRYFCIFSASVKGCWFRSVAIRKKLSCMLPYIFFHGPRNESNIYIFDMITLHWNYHETVCCVFYLLYFLRGGMKWDFFDAVVLAMKMTIIECPSKNMLVFLLSLRVLKRIMSIFSVFEKSVEECIGIKATIWFLLGKWNKKRVSKGNCEASVWKVYNDFWTGLLIIILLLLFKKLGKERWKYSRTHVLLTCCYCSHNFYREQRSYPLCS